MNATRTRLWYPDVAFTEFHFNDVEQPASLKIVRLCLENGLEFFCSGLQQVLRGAGIVFGLADSRDSHENGQASAVAPINAAGILTFERTANRSGCLSKAALVYLEQGDGWQ